MIRAAAPRSVLLFTLLAMLTAAGSCDEAAEGVAVPSGRLVQVQDVITDAPGPAGATARFRFVVPDLTAGEDASADMQALCDTHALPQIAGMDPAPQQIIIALASQAVPFGQAAPDVVQFFEAYRPADGTCIWEPF